MKEPSLDNIEVIGDSDLSNFDAPSNSDQSTPHKSLAKVKSRAVVGIQALPVVVEVHLANGLPAFSTVGMPETAVRESKDRVRSAILNSGFDFPAKRITVNLAPADLPKHGGRFDLPIAIGILVASGQISAADLAGYEFVGELALDGALRKVSGVLPTALACSKQGAILVVPCANSQEASLSRSSLALQAGHLLDVCKHLADVERMQVCEAHIKPRSEIKDGFDLSDVKGQVHAKRALELAAAGGHSLIFIGPPGTGKTMLSSRLMSLLPDLSEQEALESATIQSISDGEFDIEQWCERPFRSPHHSSSGPALVGGGSNPKPGEISRAHNGVLFLDELTEFSRSVLEQLREPIETGMINISRASGTVTYPSKFMLVAACNPCGCGYFGDSSGICSCTPASVERYLSKLSGPMLDRIDMHVHLQRVEIAELRKQSNDEPSELVKKRVVKCRERQINARAILNSQMTVGQIEEHCVLNESLANFLTNVCDRLTMSARAYHRILKLARTIADLDAQINIDKRHLAEAIAYRRLDRR